MGCCIVISTTISGVYIYIFYVTGNHSLQKKKKKSGVFFLSPRRYYKHNDQLQLDVGAFAKALEFACGVESEVVGKPSPVFFNQALADMGIQPEEVRAYCCILISNIRNTVLRKHFSPTSTQ